MSNEYLDTNSFARKDLFAAEKNPSFPDKEFDSGEILKPIRKPETLSRRRSRLKAMLQQPDFLNNLVAAAMQVLLQGIINEQFAADLGARQYQRSGQRTGQRNGYRKSSVLLPLHERRVELQIPKRRSGTFYPPILHKVKDLDEPACEDLIIELFISGVTLKRVRRLLLLLGADELHSEAVTALAGALDERLGTLKHAAV